MSKDNVEVKVVSEGQVHVSLKSSNGHIKPVRHILGKFAHEHGFSEDQITEVQLAVNEALANINEHAYEGREDGDIRIDLEKDEKGDLLIVIRDFGRKFPEGDFQSRELEDFREGGLGIFLIQTLMDLVEFDHSIPDGTSLKLIKRR